MITRTLTSADVSAACSNLETLVKKLYDGNATLNRYGKEIVITFSQIKIVNDFLLELERAFKSGDPNGSICGTNIPYANNVCYSGVAVTLREGFIQAVLSDGFQKFETPRPAETPILSTAFRLVSDTPLTRVADAEKPTQPIQLKLFK
jgi:hypothetical protein